LSSKPGVSLPRSKNVSLNFGTLWGDAIQRPDPNTQLLGNGAPAEPLATKGGNRFRVEFLETIEKHYAPFVRELRERARRIIETGEGLEITGTQRAQQKQPEGKPN
jgi:hypothetical protein